MYTGMLLFDDSKTSLQKKIEKAMNYYEKKYGCKPDLCLVHPSMMNGAIDGSTFSSDGLTIRTYRPVLPGHIWIGAEDKESK